MTDTAVTPAHDQPVRHAYVMHYPAHEPRQGDPNYVDFEAYHKRTRATARCTLGTRIKDFSECVDEHGTPVPPPDNGGEQSGLQLHHAHIEFALQNAADLQWLESAYPGVSNPDEVGAWVESAANLEWYCAGHHIGHAGVHCASSSDFEAEAFVRNLIS